jgi:hypothetical protein
VLPAALEVLLALAAWEVVPVAVGEELEELEELV